MAGAGAQTFDSATAIFYYKYLFSRAKAGARGVSREKKIPRAGATPKRTAPKLCRYHFLTYLLFSRFWTPRSAACSPGLAATATAYPPILIGPPRSGEYTSQHGGVKRSFHFRFRHTVKRSAPRPGRFHN